MEWLPPVVGAVVASVAAAVSAWLVARRFQKLGGGEAQDRLNTIRKELDEAMDEKLVNLRDQFDTCKKRLIVVEQMVKTQKATHGEAARKWVIERRELKRELFALHADLHKLQPDRTGARDRDSD